MKTLSTKYHTLNGGIPTKTPANVGENSIGMDTGCQRNWLHLWIGHHRPATKKEKKDGMEDDIWVSESVHLSREDAQHLVDEINERLF